MASAFEYRFTNVVRTPKFANARMRLARYAFAPSKLVNDTALWTGMRSTTTGSERELEVQALLANNEYLFTARSDVPVPSHLGEQRHTIALSQRGQNDWLWHTAVENHVGTMPPARLDDLMRGFLLSAERPASAFRNDYRTTFPHTTAAFGRFLSLDSVTTTPRPTDRRSWPCNSAWTPVASRVRIRPTRSSSASMWNPRWRYRLTDHSGGEWFDVQAANKRVSMRFRSHDAHLQPMEGTARAMPDTLLITADALAKFGLFTVGATNIQGTFVHIDTPRQRAWELRFTRDPEWHLPLITERLMRSPLQHLFAGRGIVFTLGFRTGPDGQTLSERVLDLPVRESAIMRFLGNLGFTAMSDFAGTVEEEETGSWPRCSGPCAPTWPGSDPWTVPTASRCRSQRPETKSPRPLSSRGLKQVPRSPSLELSVLPIGGGLGVTYTGRCSRFLRHTSAGSVTIRSYLIP